MTLERSCNDTKCQKSRERKSFSKFWYTFAKCRNQKIQCFHNGEREEEDEEKKKKRKNAQRVDTQTVENNYAAHGWLSFVEPSFHPPSSFVSQFRGQNSVYRLPAVTRRDSEITVRDTFGNRNVHACNNHCTTRSRFLLTGKPFITRSRVCVCVCVCVCVAWRAVPRAGKILARMALPDGSSKNQGVRTVAMRRGKTT